MANPRRLRAIYENENKCDRVDAQYLARIGRLDPALLFPLRTYPCRAAASRAACAFLKAMIPLASCSRAR